MTPLYSPATTLLHLCERPRRLKNMPYNKLCPKKGLAGVNENFRCIWSSRHGSQYGSSHCWRVRPYLKLTVQPCISERISAVGGLLGVRGHFAPWLRVSPSNHYGCNLDLLLVQIHIASFSGSDLGKEFGFSVHSHHWTHPLSGAQSTHSLPHLSLSHSLPALLHPIPPLGVGLPLQQASQHLPACREGCSFPTGTLADSTCIALYS